jgi:hypothetical protein
MDHLRLRQLLILLMCSASFQSMLLCGMLRKCSSFASPLTESSQSMRKRLSSFWPTLAVLRVPRGTRWDLKDAPFEVAEISRLTTGSRARCDVQVLAALARGLALTFFGGVGVKEWECVLSEACLFKPPRVDIIELLLSAEQSSRRFACLWWPSCRS